MVTRQMNESKRLLRLTLILAKPTFFSILLLLGLSQPARLHGQEPCQALISRAMNEFETAARIRAFVEALNPSTSCASWPLAMQGLAQTLIEDRNDSLTAIWLRWAIRRQPDLKPNPLEVTPEVTDAYTAARAFVTRTQSAADSVVETRWFWPAPGGATRDGRITVTSAIPGLRLQVAGAPITTGESVTRGPGSYSLIAAAPGYDSAAVTREVLPGITTVVEFDLQSRPTAGSGPTTPGPVEPQAPPNAKKGISKGVLIAGGAVVAGVAIYFLTREPDPTTGSISVDIPN